MECHLLRVWNPETTASILAEMIGGEALPLPPLSNCWVVLADAREALELHPDLLNRREAPLDVVSVGSTVPASRIATLALTAGWPSRRLMSMRGDIVEVSVEGRQVLAISTAAERMLVDDAALPREELASRA